MWKILVKIENSVLKVIIADVAPKEYDDPELDKRMEELENLAHTYGSLIVVKKIQKRTQPDFHTYIGSGKLEEIIEDMKTMGATVLIIWNILKPKQVYNINKELEKFGFQVRDRVDLILKIFDKHAKNTEAKLQIELASIKHMGPRIFGMGMEMSRQWGWSTLARWLGETNTEIMKRHLKNRKGEIERKLKQYENMRHLHREWRVRKGLLTVGIVGYTNAGKSSLMRALTHKQVLVEDKLFATLGTSVAKMYVPSLNWRGYEILINDTIGFMRDLPPQLIQAFRSTLEDSIESQLLLHVIDASDPYCAEKIVVVDQILEEIGADQKKLYVFNKVDLVAPEVLAELKKTFAGFQPLYISTLASFWLEELKQEIVNKLGL